MNSSDESTTKRINVLSHQVIGLCMEVHRELGPGLLESAYEEALAHELTLAGLRFERQKEVPLRYKGVSLNCGYRLDIVVEGELILEIKSVSQLQPIHQAQTLTYVKLERRGLGLLINFNVPLLKNGITRVASREFIREQSKRFRRFPQRDPRHWRQLDHLAAYPLRMTPPSTSATLRLCCPKPPSRFPQQSRKGAKPNATPPRSTCR